MKVVDTMKMPVYKTIPAGLYSKSALVSVVSHDQLNRWFTVEFLAEDGQRQVSVFPYEIPLLPQYRNGKSSMLEAIKCAIDCAENCDKEMPE